MIDVKNAGQVMIKTMGETLELCGLAVSVPQGSKKDDVPMAIDEDKAVITFESDSGAVKIMMEDGKVRVLGAQGEIEDLNDEDYKEIMLGLFEYDKDYFNESDVKSASNEISESVQEFFGVSKKAAAGQGSKTAAKKGGKNSTVTYETENLAVRIANVYTELKEDLNKNIEDYKVFLEEEFFTQHANEYIMKSIRDKDTQKLKKLFSIFNLFYEEGSSDTQSLVAVTILGSNLLGQDEMLETVENYMDEELKSAVLHVIKYLSGPSGKRAIKVLENPKPYKAKKSKIKI
ncbi:MAG: hypothetical protein LBH71_00720 [Oscillospiraceae bacterium]|jgi:hypothetical protein|nr:hypothetical protein [Oscillospiraceae bacterium]